MNQFEFNYKLRIFQDRINELEHKISKNGKKPDISRAEKSAIFHELGVFDYLLSKGIPQNKIAELLGLVFNASVANIVKDMSLRNTKEAPFKTRDVYAFLIDRFKGLQLDDLEAQAQEILNRIEK
jgi:hypothetical protein